ncbi:MAG TPA: CotH kinase family protein [Fibrobacteraceae bacterium]|nr:CotH kinase family protein [Fibrobacteraceae bacterium]
MNMRKMVLTGFLGISFWGCTSTDYPHFTQEDADLVYVGSAPVQFTEVTPRNISYEDHLGKTPSWVEVYNPADTAVDLYGYSLTNDLSKPWRWSFGHLVVQPKSYELVFLSGESITTTEAASDSINLMTGIGYSWADDQNDPAGNSTVGKYEYDRIFDQDEDGNNVVSATLTLGDNSDILDWASAIVFMGIEGYSSSDTVDLSGTNTLVIRGYIQASRELIVRLAQPDYDEWLGWAATLTGTGDTNTEYRIALPQGTTFPDLEHIYGLRIEIATYLTTTRFTFRDVYAYKAPIRMHASFELDKSGGTLYLTDSSGIRDTLAYPNVPAGRSWGRDSLGNSGYLSPPTPYGTPQGIAVTEQASEALSVTEAGFYDSSVSVSIDVPENSTVHYTLDGAIPTESSSTYTGPILIDSSTVLRSVTIKDGALASDISTRSYFIADSATLPVVSIGVDPGAMFNADTGIYEDGPDPGSEEPYYGANYWMPRELPVSIEFFESGGSLQFQQNGGLDIYGNYSRMQPKKSVGIAFREKYGDKDLDYALFPDASDLDEFRKFGLRNYGGNYGSDYIRDALAQNLTKGLDVDHQQNRPVIVYYNGSYYGLHQLVEKMDKNWPKTHHGYDPDYIDLLEPFDVVSSGSPTDFNNMKTFMEENDMSLAENYAHVDTLLDVNSYLNYLAVEIYANNTDWPANNYHIWRCTSPLTKFRYMMFDMDFTFASGNAPDSLRWASTDMFAFLSNESETPEWPNGSASTLVYRHLMENDEFKNALINRLALLLSWQFSSSRVRAMADSMMEAISSQMERDQDHWNLSYSYMDKELTRIQTFISDRPSEMRNQMRDHFGLGADLSATLSVSGSGVIQVNGLSLPFSPFIGTWFSGQPLTLTAVAESGKTFTGWSDGESSVKRIWTPTAGATLSATFK